MEIATISDMSDSMQYGGDLSTVISHLKHFPFYKKPTGTKKIQEAMPFCLEVLKNYNLPV